MILNEVTYRKIEVKEFNKLKSMFPGNEELWNKYKKERVNRLKNKEIDIYVIEKKNEFIGEITVNYISHELETETIPNKRVYFEAFRVEKQYQGNGLGQNLLEYTINELKENGYVEFTIGVEEDNQLAKHIYFKYGFTEVIDKGQGDEFDPSEYTLYLKSIKIDNVINKLLEKCDLGGLVDLPIRVSGGLLNRMYKVKTTKGTFAIKQLNPEVMKRKDSLNNHIFAEKVANIAKEKGISCLPAKLIDGSSIQEIEGMYFSIFDWFNGKPIIDEELTIKKCKIVAKELAKLHNIDFSELENNCKAYYDLKEIDWNFYLDKITNVEIKELLNKNIARYSILDKNSIKALNCISNNIVISHRDLDLPNILWNENKLMIIDWESTGIVNPVMEVIDTAWNWSGGQNYFDINKFNTFISSYEENGGKIKDFNKAIEADFKAKFGWLEYNLKRVCGIECLDKEEKMLGEKEVIRTIDEINKFDYYSQFMK